MVNHLKPNYSDFSESAKMLNRVFDFIVGTNKFSPRAPSDAVRYWIGADNFRKIHIFTDEEDGQIKAVRIIGEVLSSVVNKESFLFDELSHGESKELDDYVELFKKMRA